MDPNAIAPFIKATQNIFEMMLQLHVDVGEPTVKQPGASSNDVSAIISFTGDFDGSVVLSFPEATACRAVSLFTGTEISEPNDDLTDAVGELVNMIAGGAKAQFTGKKIQISCPNVVVGKSHVVQGGKDAVCVIIPCECECGDFTLELSIKGSTGEASADTRTAAEAQA